MKLRRMAAVLPPLSLPKNVQLPRLCSVAHNRGYVQALIMCSSQSPNIAPAGSDQWLAAHNLTDSVRTRAALSEAGIEPASSWAG
jgi:hypothetical protein